MAISRDQSIVILTGAGISKESGLDTFRDADGLWAEHRIEDVATPEGFARDPGLVQSFYNARRRSLGSVHPNAAHQALAHLEREWPGGVFLVTQNVDDLHERGGSCNILHMHGELLKVRCVECRTVFDWAADLPVDERCHDCGSQGSLRPHIVWFGEIPFGMDVIQERLEDCGLFMSIGTSGNVYPAAGFVQLVRRVGKAHTVELNLEPSKGATLFRETVYGPATRVVPEYVERILNGKGGRS